MDRIKVPSGSIQKFETVFDDLQTLIDNNLNKRINAITGNFGVITHLVNGESSSLGGNPTNLLVVNPKSGLSLSIYPGVAMLEDESILLVEDIYNFTLSEIFSGTITAGTFYQINLKWKEVGTNPIVAMNAFFFDKTGVTPYSERYTRWSDSYEAVAYVRTESVPLATPDGEIPLAIVKTFTDTDLEDSNFTFQDVYELRSSSAAVIDLRQESTYRLNHDVLDDSLLLFKDRDSIGENKINASIEVNDLLSETITISGISTLATTNVTGPLTVYSTSSSTSSWLNIHSGYLSTAAVVFKNGVGYRGYVAFDANTNFGVGFSNPIASPDEIDSIPTGQRFVVTNYGYLGNYYQPTVELDLKNISTSADGTTIKLSHVPTTASSSTIFKFGVGSTGGSTYGRGLIQPITYDRPFEFLNLSGNYVFKLDNANRKAYAYALEVENGLITSALTATSTITNTLTVSGLTQLSDTSIDFLTISGLSVAANDVSSINLPGTSSTEFRVGVGSQEYPTGRLVKLEDPDVETPANFRIFDVAPYPDERASASNITFKWNWDGLDGAKSGLNEVILNYNTTTGEALNLTRGQAIIRYFYFPSSGNKYEITDYDVATRTVTLANNHTAQDIISNTQPARIIDKSAEYYVIRVSEVDRGVVSDRGSTYTLQNSDLVNLPVYVLKLRLNQTYSFSIRAGNKSYTSPFVTMLPGSYDPDHVAGGQGVRGYSSPFDNTLPYIDGACSPGTLTLTSTAYGFTLDIEGWESEDVQSAPHQFEVAYTTLSGITWDNSTNSTTKKSGATYIRTTNRTLQISTNQSTVWTVGVRPIQNNNPVGIPVLSTVVSGGGGIVPNDAIVVGPLYFNIAVVSGIIVDDVLNTTDSVLISGLNSEVWGEDTLAGIGITIGAEETKILSNKTTILV